MLWLIIVLLCVGFVAGFHGSLFHRYKSIGQHKLCLGQNKLCLAKENVSLEKFTIMSFHDLITIDEMISHLKSHWKELTKGLPNNSTILFYAGAHGTHYDEDGLRKPSGKTRIRSFENSCQIIECLKKKLSILENDRVFNLMNIKLVVQDISKDLTPDGNVRETVIKDHLQSVNPQMVVLLTCYSRFANFKTMFERNGIFAKMKLSRELCILSNGHFITLNKEQADFIDKMAKEENIEKDVEIFGAVGSGKTVLGEQVVIMKLNHYKEKYHVLPMDCKQKFRVIFLDCSTYAYGINTSIDTALIKHWQNEVTKVMEQECTLEVISLKFGFDFIAADPKWRDYRHTIVMIDEAFIQLLENRNMKVIHEKRNSIPIDVVICYHYADFSRFLSIHNPRKSMYNQDQLIQCSLPHTQRSSQQIMDLAHFLQVHETGWSRFSIRPYSNQKSYQGPTPIWLDLIDSQALHNYAKSNWVQLQDAMVIFIGEVFGLDDFKNFCYQRLWKVCNNGTSVFGAEASTVIMICAQHDWHPFSCFERYTRAKHQLIIVTFPGSTERPRYEKIASGYHDKGNCEFYCSEYKWNYGKSFVCQFHGKEKIKQLLLKNPNVPLKARNDPYSPFVQKTLETENDYKLIQATQEVYL